MIWRQTHSRSWRCAFSLIELLVVVAIIAIMLALMVPLLGSSRRKAAVAACAANQRQLMTAVVTYAVDHRGYLACGPNTILQNGVRWQDIASNWIWVESMQKPNAHGLLLKYLQNKEPVFCPTVAEDVIAPQLAAMGMPPGDVYSSYLYRNLDQASGRKISSLGRNDAGQPATAVLMDYTQIGPGPIEYRGHDSLTSNIAYIDGHVKALELNGHWLTTQGTDYVGFPADISGLERRMNQMLVNADWAERGTFEGAPQLP